MLIRSTWSIERSTHVVALEPSSCTVSPSTWNSARAGPRITTLVSPSPVLTSTKAGRSRSPPEISASRVTSKPAPPSTSSQSAATRGFSVGGRITTARSPTIPNHSPGR